jgi:hypothetical protein
MTNSMDKVSGAGPFVRKLATWFTRTAHRIALRLRSYPIDLDSRRRPLVYVECRRRPLSRWMQFN